MHRPPNKKTLRYRLVAIYTIVPILILLVSAFLVMYSVGYRFNLKSQQISQGGLLQIRSEPSGSVVTVDNKKVDGRTPNRADLSAGLHTVMITRDGYRPWQKTITIEPGKILWLNYARLIPKNITSVDLSEYSSKSRTLAADDGKTIALMADSSLPELSLIKLDKVKKTERTLQIPQEVYQKSQSNSFELIEWSEDSRYLLMKHSFGKKSELMMIDTSDLKQSVNLNYIVGQGISRVEFMAEDPTSLYVLAAGALRAVDTRAKTVSAPIMTQVSDFSQNSKGVIAYATHRDKKTKQRSVGFYTKGASKPYAIRTFYDNDSKPLQVKIGEYSNKRYIAVQYGTSIEVSQIPSVASDNVSSMALTSLVTIAVPSATDKVSFSPTSRFVLMTHDDSFISYDLELGALASTTLKGGVDQKYQLGWLDPYMLWSTQSNTLTTYEYDGGNSQEIMTNIASNQAVMLGADNRSIYAFIKADNRLKLVQISLTAK